MIAVKPLMMATVLVLTITCIACAVSAAHMLGYRKWQQANARMALYIKHVGS